MRPTTRPGRKQPNATRWGGNLDPSHARESLRSPGANCPPHTGPDGRLPLKRARKQGVRLDDGTVIAFPHMPHVADLPPGWRHFSTAEKIKHLLGKISLDQARDILSWPRAGLDPAAFAGQRRNEEDAPKSDMSLRLPLPLSTLRGF